MLESSREFCEGKIAVKKIIIKMQGAESANRSPGKTHVIRLNEKDLTVRVSYSSPEARSKSRYDEGPSLNNKLRLPPKPKGQASKPSAKQQFKNRTRKKEKVLSKKKQKEFYVRDIEDCHTLLHSYEQFHQNLAQKKTKKRLKVFSNSKTQSRDESAPNYHPVPIKTINLKPTKPAKALLSQQKQIKLLPNKSSRQDPRLWQDNIGKFKTIRLYQKGKHGGGSVGTPEKCRSQKLEVTLSQSRRRNESLLSKRAQFSSELVREGTFLGQQGQSIIVNSFNTSLNH